MKSSFLIFFAFLKTDVFILLPAISKRLKLQKPDWTHFENNMPKMNFFFFKKAILEAEISLVEGFGILIGILVHLNQHLHFVSVLI